MTDTRHDARRRWALVAASVAVVLYGIVGFPNPAGIEPETAAADTQQTCISVFWGAPVVPPYCHTVAHTHPPPDPPSCPSGYHSHSSNLGCHTHSVGCTSAEHSHGGLGCHAAGTDHSPQPPDPQEPDRGGGGGGGGVQSDNGGCGVNYVNNGNGCELVYQPNPDTASCPAGTEYNEASQLCITEDGREDLDVTESISYNCGPREWEVDGECVIKSREDDPDRSQHCPAGQVFYSTLGCASPCPSGQVLSGGSCHSVGPTRPVQQPGDPPPPPTCQLGYSGTPPNCVAGTPEVYVIAQTVSESGGSVSVAIVLSHAAANTGTVDVTSFDGTATDGSDYSAITSHTVTFAAGSREMQVSVSILDDSAYEPDETFTMTLSNPSGDAELGSSTSADITIADDDVPLVGITPKPA